MMSPIILLTGLSVFCRALPSHHHRVKDAAIERLSKVFGLPSASAAQMHQPDPPQYMLNLYNSVADQNGVTRSSNPYNATVIRSFVNKGALNSGVLFFNVSGVEPKETILQAELRLFRHKQRGIYNVEIYQISDLHGAAAKNRLLVTKYIDAGDSAWETFNIYPAVTDWVSGQSANLGLLIVTTSLQGKPSRLFRDGPISVGDKVPILVLFSTSKESPGDGKPNHTSCKNESHFQVQHTMNYTS